MVYLITDGNNVKIGYSNDTKKRLKNLQTSNPYKLKLLLNIKDGDMELESFLHYKFSKLRIRNNGEWFKYDASIQKFVEEVKSDPEHPHNLLAQYIIKKRKLKELRKRFKLMQKEDRENLKLKSKKEAEERKALRKQKNKKVKDPEVEAIKQARRLERKLLRDFRFYRKLSRRVDIRTRNKEWKQRVAEMVRRSNLSKYENKPSRRSRWADVYKRYNYKAKVRDMDVTAMKPGTSQYGKAYFLKEYVENKKSLTVLSRETGLSLRGLAKRMDCYGIARRAKRGKASTKGGSRKIITVMPEDQLRSFVKEGKTASWIANFYGTKYETVQRRLHKYGLKTVVPRRVKARLNITQHLTKERLYDLYITQNLTSRQMAEKLGIAASTVWLHLDKHNIKKKDIL